MAIIGYARVSTQDQRLDLQIDALQAIGADPVHTDQLSGGRAVRPGLSAALAAVQAGDTLAVWRLDRLGRSLSHLVRTVAELRERGVRILSVTEAIDTETTHGRLLLGLVATLAEYERDLIRERVAAGTIAARKAGRHPGRRPKLTPARADAARRELAAGVPSQEVARTLGMARSTLFAGLARADAEAAQAAGGLPVKRKLGRPRKSRDPGMAG